jgi:hypothetical protein
MAFCTPALLTGLIFLGLVIYDLQHKEFEMLAPHTIMGLLAVLLVGVLCNENASYVAWGLLAIPFVVLLLPIVAYILFLIYYLGLLLSGNTTSFEDAASSTWDRWRYASQPSPLKN